MVLGQQVGNVGGERKKEKKINLLFTPFTKSISDRSMTMERKFLQFIRKRRERQFCDLGIGNG